MSDALCLMTSYSGNTRGCPHRRTESDDTYTFPEDHRHFCDAYVCDLVVHHCPNNGERGRLMFCLVHEKYDGSEEQTRRPSDEQEAAANARTKANEERVLAARRKASECAHVWTEPDVIKDFSVICSKCRMMYHKSYRDLTAADHSCVGFFNQYMTIH